jgi:hypothetical protein
LERGGHEKKDEIFLTQMQCCKSRMAFTNPNQLATHFGFFPIQNLLHPAKSGVFQLFFRA